MHFEFYSTFIKKTLLKQKTLCLFLTLFHSLIVFSEDNTASFLTPPRDNFIHVRSMGTAGAFSSVANDNEAIFLNPGGISYRDISANPPWIPMASFPHIIVGANKDFVSFFNNYKNSSKNSSLAEEKLIQNESDKSLYARTSLFPNFIFGRMQFGYLIDNDIFGYTEKYNPPQPSIVNLPNSYDTKIYLNVITQTGPVAGLSVPYKDLGISLGVSARAMGRATIFEEYEGYQGEYLVKPKANKQINYSSGLAIDLGTLFRRKMKWGAMSVGVSALDVADTHYLPLDENSRKEIQKMNILAGAGIEKNLGKSASFSFFASGKFLNDDRIATKDKFAIGSEINFGSPLPFLTLRGGWNMKNFSYGITTSLIFFNLDVSSHTESVKTKNQTIIDRRYNLKLSVNLVE